MSETAKQTIPNRRQRRAAMKNQGILKMKSKLSFKEWLEIVKIANWKEEGYTDKEIEKLREAYSLIMVKDKSTWHADKKLARKTIKELTSTLYKRKS